VEELPDKSSSSTSPLTIANASLMISIRSDVEIGFRIAGRSDEERNLLVTTPARDGATWTQLSPSQAVA
jgi:hypothetical protein